MKAEDAAQLYVTARQKYAENTAESLLKLVHGSGVLPTAAGTGLGALTGYLASKDDDWARINPRAHRRAMLNNILAGSIIGGGTGALAHGIYGTGQLAKDMKETPPIEEEFKPNNAPEEVAFIPKDRKGKPLSLNDAKNSTVLAALSLLEMKGLGNLATRTKAKPNATSNSTPSAKVNKYTNLAVRGGKATAALLAAVHGRNAIDTLGAKYAPSWLNVTGINTLATPVLPDWARAARQFARGPSSSDD
jgi:hypothetical protein